MMLNENKTKAFLAIETHNNVYKICKYTNLTYITVYGYIKDFKKHKLITTKKLKNKCIITYTKKGKKGVKAVEELLKQLK